MNICMVGYGMMGTWHSEALRTEDVCLKTLVGRRPDQAKEFAARYGYNKWTTDLNEALADDAIDVVILANPSEQHTETALAAIAHHKHTLVEIPLALNLADCEQIVAAAQQAGVRLGVVHPLRARPEMIELRARVAAGQEQIRQISGRFFIHRLENVGATGYQRSWTDNLLWHHTTHLLDLAMWLSDAAPAEICGFMSPLDTRTGTPMEVALCIETTKQQTLVCTGSYYGRERIFDTLIITDRDSYRLDVFASTLTTGAGTQPIEHEDVTCQLVTRDFIAAVRDSRAPLVPGEAVLPTMRVLQEIQDRWDARYGRTSIPGRTV